jgi:hypothetical protein
VRCGPNDSNASDRARRAASLENQLHLGDQPAEKCRWEITLFVHRKRRLFAAPVLGAPFISLLAQTRGNRPVEGSALGASLAGIRSFRHNMTVRNHDFLVFEKRCARPKKSDFQRAKEHETNTNA